MRWESRRFDSFSVYSVCPCGPLAGCRAVTWLLQWGGWQKEANSLLYIPDACVWCSVLKLFWETSTNIQWSLFIYVSAGTFHTQHVSLDVTPAKTFSAAPRLQASSFFVAVVYIVFLQHLAIFSHSWETFLLNLQAVARSMLILTWIDKLEIFHSGIQHCLPWRGVNKLKWKSPTSFWHVWTRL